MPETEGLMDFSTPPVAEAVIAAEFPDVPELSAVRLIELQREWAEDYPELELRDALPPMAVVGPMFQFATQPSLRIWALNQASGMLVQLQSNRIAVNWRALEGGAPYPRYESLRNEFDKRWRSLGAATPTGVLPAPTTVEFVYVNRIELDDTDVMETFVKWGAAADSGERVVDEFRAVRLISSPEMPDRELKVIGRAAGDPSAGKAVLSLNIEVRSVVGPVVADWMGVVDQCRLDARRMFQSITTEQAHEKWGKR